MQVRELLVHPPVTVDVAATVADAARTLGAEGVGCLIVTDGGRPVGVVTDRDIVLRGVARNVPLDARIDSLMTMGIATVSADASVESLVEMFGSKAVRRVPVVEGERVVGLVSLDDLLVRLAGQIGDLTRGLTAQLLFPHAGDEPLPPAVS